MARYLCDWREVEEEPVLTGGARVAVTEERKKGKRARSAGGVGLAGRVWLARACWAGPNWSGSASPFFLKQTFSPFQKLNKHNF